MNPLLEAMELIETARAKIIEFRNNLGPEKNEEDSQAWMTDGYLEEASDNLRNSLDSIESAMQEETIEP